MIDKEYFKRSICRLCTSKGLEDTQLPNSNTLRIWYQKMKHLTDDQFFMMIENMDSSEEITIKNLLLSLPNYEGERGFIEYILKNNYDILKNEIEE